MAYADLTKDELKEELDEAGVEYEEDALKDDLVAKAEAELDSGGEGDEDEEENDLFRVAGDAIGYQGEYYNEGDKLRLPEDVALGYGVEGENADREDAYLIRL